MRRGCDLGVADPAAQDGAGLGRERRAERAQALHDGVRRQQLLARARAQRHVARQPVADLHGVPTGHPHLHGADLAIVQKPAKTAWELRAVPSSWRVTVRNAKS